MVAKCPKYWIQMSGTEDCYKIHTYGSLRTWEDAEEYCERYMANLVSVFNTNMKVRIKILSWNFIS